MKDKKVGGSNHHGFKKGQINLISFYEVTGSVDKGRAMDLLYLDSRKTSDSFPQSTMAVRLEHRLCKECL